MAVNSRTKGAVGERELAALLRSKGWPDAVRGQQRSGRDQADVVGGPAGVHLEVKRVEKLRVHVAYAQACRDAPPGQTPVVVHRVNGGGWLATLSLDDLLAMLAVLKSPLLD